MTYTTALFGIAWLICVWTEYRLSRYADGRIAKMKSEMARVQSQRKEVDRRLQTVNEMVGEFIKMVRAPADEFDEKRFLQAMAKYNSQVLIYRAQDKARGEA